METTTRQTASVDDYKARMTDSPAMLEMVGRWVENTTSSDRDYERLARWMRDSLGLGSVRETRAAIEAAYQLLAEEARAEAEEARAMADAEDSARASYLAYFPEDQESEPTLF